MQNFRGTSAGENTRGVLRACWLACGLFLLASMGCSSTAAFAAGAGDAVVGTWLTADGASRVRISRTGDTYSGRVAWLEEPRFPSNDPDGMAGRPKVDRRNPDAALRSRPIIGLTILSGLHYAGNDAWSGGTIYTPATGKSYPCKLSLGPDGVLKLAVGGRLFGRTISWKRVTAAPQSSAGNSS